MKTSLITTLSIAGVLLAAGSAYAVNATVLSSPSLETIGSSETAAVIVPHEKVVEVEQPPSASDVVAVPAPLAPPSTTATPESSPSSLGTADATAPDVRGDEDHGDEDDVDSDDHGDDDSDDSEESDEDDEEYGDDDD